MRYRVSIALVFTLTACGVFAQSDEPLKGPIPITSATVSAAAAATWGTTVDSNGTNRLAFLVLSRGTLGWVFRAGPFQTSGAGSPIRRDGLIGPQVVVQQVSIRGVEYRISLDRAADTLTIGSHTVALAGEGRMPGASKINAVLVDDIDSPAGPHIVKTLWVDPEMATPHTGGIVALIRRTPELQDFVRCDLTVDDPDQQRVVDYLCREV